jgi:tetratricopeptide (TPR) repeat protein
LSSCLIKSCIGLFYLCITAVPAHAQSAATLYGDRADLSSARRAADLWRAALAADPRDFESAVWLARASYWLGGHAPESEQRAFHEEGIAAGQRAIAIDPNRVEGHYWTAANMGALAERFGVRTGLRYRKPIKDELEIVLRLDPGYLDGSADRALGRWYHKVPRLFGGNRRKAEDHFKAALKYNADSIITHYFLADLYSDEDRQADARTELQRVIDAPIDPDWAPEDNEFKIKAAHLLERQKR